MYSMQSWIVSITSEIPKTFNVFTGILEKVVSVSFVAIKVSCRACITARCKLMKKPALLCSGFFRSSLPIVKICCLNFHPSKSQGLFSCYPSSLQWGFIPIEAVFVFSYTTPGSPHFLGSEPIEL